MDTRMRPQAPRQYEDFNPETRLVSEDGSETVLLYLTEYKKEQLRVQLTSTRLLKISGERQLGANKWQRFTKEIPVPPNCAAQEITAKFQDGVLHVKQPKVMTSPDVPPQPQPIQPVPNPAPVDGKRGGLVAASENNVAETKEEERAEPSKSADTEKRFEEESRDKVGNKGIYRMLKKPENLKTLAAVVAVAVAIALNVGYVKRVCGSGR